MTKDNGLIGIKVWLSPEDFTTYCDYAIQAGFRHGGSKPYVITDAIANKTSPNTQGLAKLMKFCVTKWPFYYKDHKIKIEQLMKEKEVLDKQIQELEAGIQE